MPDRAVDRAAPGRALARGLTVRAERAPCRRVGRDNTPVAVVARDWGTGWRTIMRAVDCHGRELIGDPTRLAGVTALGVDETAFLRTSPLRSTQFVSGLVDTATGRLLDVVADRTAKAVIGWLADRDPAWLAAVGVVTPDPHRGFANAVGYRLYAAIAPRPNQALHDEAWGGGGVTSAGKG